MNNYFRKKNNSQSPMKNRNNRHQGNYNFNNIYAKGNRKLKIFRKTGKYKKAS